MAQLGWGLLAAMGVVLLIGAANIAALVFVRSLRRTQEFAIGSRSAPAACASFS